MTLVLRQAPSQHSFKVWRVTVDPLYSPLNLLSSRLAPISMSRSDPPGGGEGDDVEEREDIPRRARELSEPPIRRGLRVAAVRDQAALTSRAA
eukprot:CAMPEP_0182453788 /NCGR_PEP_ID=MMETSP1319-20130603/701_1 /TAXON_ID=172717 /ORGANISM="Bolidomonas pacifica, Strain RCC208" /LENGTH=92 /DNA_ID=CAMNT_0024651743 /DNA_START=771 /DNA_END=1046 /DNA_ORIENTATION=+